MTGKQKDLFSNPSVVDENKVMLALYIKKTYKIILKQVKI